MMSMMKTKTTTTTAGGSICRTARRARRQAPQRATSLDPVRPPHASQYPRSERTFPHHVAFPMHLAHERILRDRTLDHRAYPLDDGIDEILQTLSWMRHGRGFWRMSHQLQQTRSTQSSMTFALVVVVVVVVVIASIQACRFRSFIRTAPRSVSNRQLTPC